MSSYKLGPMTQSGENVYESRRPLCCENCEGVLGEVWAVAEYSHLPADMVQRRWPEMAEKVRQHEELCLWSSWYRDLLNLPKAKASRPPALRR
jgi:hypothetical protein